MIRSSFRLKYILFLTLIKIRPMNHNNFMILGKETLTMSKRYIRIFPFHLCKFILRSVFLIINYLQPHLFIIIFSLFVLFFLYSYLFHDLNKAQLFIPHHVYHFFMRQLISCYLFIHYYYYFYYYFFIFLFLKHNSNYNS